MSGDGVKNRETSEICGSEEMCFLINRIHSDRTQLNMKTI